MNIFVFKFHMSSFLCKYLISNNVQVVLKILKGQTIFICKIRHEGLNLSVTDVNEIIFVTSFTNNS